VQGLKARSVDAGVLAAESTIRFFIVAGIRQASSAYESFPPMPSCAHADDQSPAELALMQVANASRLQRCATCIRRLPWG